MQQEPSIKVKTWEAILITIILLSGISYCMIALEAPPHIPIVLSMIFLISYGLCKGVKYREIEQGMMDGTKSGLGATFLFFFIGMLISSWMASGTIPTFIYYSLDIVGPNYFYAICFVVTAIIGMSIGSSLTTAATIGVAFMGLSGALDLNPAITAGAIISGAFFGDKMSPLSDTTNLASMTVGVDLFDHIKTMSMTTIPVFILSFIIFLLISPKGMEEASLVKINEMQEGLLALGLVKWYAIIPFLVLVVLAIKKIPALITLASSIVTAIIVSFFVQNEMNLGKLITILFSGYTSNSGIEDIDSLLTRGGIESMFFSISLVLLALAMGGLFIKLGILAALIRGITDYLSKRGPLISATASTAVGINFIVGEQYLSILLTGNAYKESFNKANLHPRYLSRVLEDAGTVVNPLVPWSVCGIFLTTVLDVNTLTYLPFALFCLISPLMTILYGWTGWTMKKQ